MAPTASGADPNQPPVAVDDPPTPGCIPFDSWGGAYPLAEDITGYDMQYPGWLILFGACNPMINDTDPDGDPLTLELVGEPAHGESMWLPEGFIGYRPEPDFSTLPGDVAGGSWVSDVIQYRLFDGTDYSNVANYRFWVAPVNDPPSFTPGAESVEARMGDGQVSAP